MSILKVTLNDGESVNVRTDGGETAAKAHVAVLEADRVARAKAAGVTLVARGVQSITTLKGD